MLISVFSKKQINDILREGLMDASMSMLMECYTDHFTEEIYKKYVVIDGETNFRQIKTEKKTPIMAMIHSNFLLSGAALTGYFEKMHTAAFVDEKYLSLIQRFHAKIRRRQFDSMERVTNNYIVGKGSLSAKFRSLIDEGNLVSVCIDGIHSSTFFTIPFFNKKIRLPGGIFWIAAKNQAPMIPFFWGFDREQNIFRIWIGKPIQNENPETIAREYVIQFEQHLRKHPSHWTGWWRMKFIRDENGEEVFVLHKI